MMGWSAIAGAVLQILLQSGGAKKLQEFFTRHKDELLELKKSRREPGTTAPPPEEN